MARPAVRPAHKMTVPERRLVRTGGVLILMATYGEGHRRAAEAVAAALRELRPDLPIDVVDYFEQVSPRVNRFARTLYVGGVRHTPGLYGRWYRRTAHIPEKSWLQRQLDRYGLTPLAHLLGAYRPQAVLSTFPIPAGVLSTLRLIGQNVTPSAVAITDFTVHSQWVHSGIDRYFVAADELRQGIAAKGIPAERIHVSGIPIDPSFRKVVTSASPLDRPRVMIMGGAYGMMKDAVHLAGRLATLPSRPQVLIMAGRDQVLLRAAEELTQRLGADRVIAQPFTRDVARLMASCHLLVTKAGGLTVSEALAIGLPMVIHRPIPGQEWENLTFLDRHRAVKVAHGGDHLVRQVGALLADRTELRRLSDAARELGRPDAAREVAWGMLRLIEEGPSRAPSSGLVGAWHA